MKDDNKPILSEVFNHVADLKAVASSRARQEGSKTAIEQRQEEEDEGLGPTSLLLGSGAVLLLAVAVIRKFRSRRASTKKGKIF